jgi:hypothetical protein
VVVPDDEPIDGERHDQALARVRALLLDLGCTNEEIDRAVADDVVDLLVVDRMVVPSRVRLTPEQVTETTDIPLDLARRFWRALGFTDVDDDEAVFTDLDIEAVRLFQTMVAMDMVDVDSAVQMARVIGTSMARIAEAETVVGGQCDRRRPVRPTRRHLAPGHGSAVGVRVASPSGGRHPEGHAHPDPTPR